MMTRIRQSIFGTWEVPTTQWLLSVTSIIVEFYHSPGASRTQAWWWALVKTTEQLSPISKQVSRFSNSQLRTSTEASSGAITFMVKSVPWTKAEMPQSCHSSQKVSSRTPIDLTRPQISLHLQTLHSDPNGCSQNAEPDSVSEINSSPSTSKQSKSKEGKDNLVSLESIKKGRMRTLPRGSRSSTANLRASLWPKYVRKNQRMLRMITIWWSLRFSDAFLRRISMIYWKNLVSIRTRPLSRSKDILEGRSRDLRSSSKLLPLFRKFSRIFQKWLLRVPLISSPSLGRRSKLSKRSQNQ